MAKYIAVAGCLLKCTPSAQAQIQTPASTTTLAAQNGCYRGAVSIMVTGATAVSDGNGMGTGALQGTAQFTLIDGMPAVLEGDKVSVQVSGTSGGSPATGTVVVEIVGAGQNVVLGE